MARTRESKQGKPATPRQWRQRELSWLLYISEGYAANLSHALRVNAYTLDQPALNLMRKATESAYTTCERLRAALTEMKED